MTPERHQQINEICHAVLQLPTAERTAFLAHACQDDADLQREVESLLIYESLADTFIEKPAIDVLARTLALEPPRTGQQISHFQLLAPLGKGGMGEVYLALDQRLGRKVAIKLLLPEFTANKAFVARFDQEARAASALNHPNIITVYEIDEWHGLHFIAAELVEGQTLRQLMNQQRLPVTTILEIAVQVTSALQAAHQAGIVHRDIKPENIMVRPDGLVKVLDFGLAKLTATRSAERGARNENSDDQRSAISAPPSTTSGLVMGTVGYMSPEQASGLPLDPRTDLFSLGVMLYEMLTGRLPFSGTTPMEVIGNILHQEPAPITSLTVSGAELLTPVIAKALRKEPAARYPVAQEMLADLKQCRENLDTAPRMQSADRLTVRQIPLRWALATGVLFLALTVAGITIWRLRKVVAPPRSAITTLAILPLKSLARNTDDAPLGLGITGTIITKVSRINGLIVRPISAVRRYAEQDVDALQAAREQRVDAVLDGTIQHDGERLRISVNLLRVSDGASLWADQFDLNFTEIFSLQDKVAQQVVERLHYQISAEEQSRIAKRHTTNAQAYAHFVKATYYFGDRKMLWWQRDLTDHAVEFLKKAIALDPQYALARVMLAYGYAHTAIMHEENPALIDLATAELARAERLDPQLAEIHVVRSFILFSHYRGYPFAETLAELRQAQSFDPNVGHFELAFLYAHLGLKEWEGELERALELEPVSEVIKDHIIRFNFLDLKPEEGMAAVKRFAVRAQDPIYPQYLAMYYTGKQMPAEAWPVVAAIAEKKLDGINFRGLVLALQGKFQEAETTIKVDWEQHKIPPVYHPVFHHFTHNAARIYALAGKPEEAMKWLRLTAKEGYPNYSVFLHDAYLNSLHQHPPFSEFMDELRFRWESYQRAIRSNLTR